MKRLLLLVFLCGMFITSFNGVSYSKVDIPVEEINTIPELNVENLRKELIRRNIPQHKIVLAQALHETGNFKSKICRERNNIFGMRNKKGYKCYEHWIACVEDYEKRFSRRYKGGDYFKFLVSVHYHEDPMYEQRVRKFIKKL